MICEACNVRELWEHRCHGKPCACSECREADRLFGTPGVVNPPESRAGGDADA